MNQTFRLLTSALLAAFAASLLTMSPAAAAGGAKKKSSGSESFIELESVTATIVQDYRPAGLFQVELGLEVPDHDLQETVMHLEPRLRTACSDALRAYAGDMYVPGTVPDADLIASMMQDAVDQALGEPGAQLVLGMLVVQSGAR